jgi:hypothetical protein
MCVINSQGGVDGQRRACRHLRRDLHDIQTCNATFVCGEAGVRDGLGAGQAFGRLWVVCRR